jgi:hypothetical protein
MSGHQEPVKGKSDEWLTPPEIIKALGPFNLDPCAPVQRPWSMARHYYTEQDDGLAQRWRGLVWLNPPFSQADQWLERMVEHGNGIALLAARTETRIFQERVWGGASTSSLLFLKRRPHFHYVTGERASFNSGTPIVLVAYGSVAKGRLFKAWGAGSLEGALVEEWLAP